MSYNDMKNHIREAYFWWGKLFTIYCLILKLSYRMVYAMWYQLCNVLINLVSLNLKILVDYGIFQRTRTNNFTIYMEIQKTLNSQSNLEKEEWDWRDQPAWLQTILQSYSHQDSLVLAQRQKYISVEQNRKIIDKSTHLWMPYLWQMRQEYTMEKRQSL